MKIKSLLMSGMALSALMLSAANEILPSGKLVLPLTVPEMIDAAVFDIIAANED